MPHAGVEEYAAVYRRQDDYLVAQSRTEDAGVAAFSVFATGLEGFGNCRIPSWRPNADVFCN